MKLDDDDLWLLRHLQKVSAFMPQSALEVRSWDNPEDAGDKKLAAQFRTFRRLDAFCKHIKLLGYLDFEKKPASIRVWLTALGKEMLDEIDRQPALRRAKWRRRMILLGIQLLVLVVVGAIVGLVFGTGLGFFSYIGQVFGRLVRGG